MKRLIICCDGTWNGIKRGNATNVLQLARSIPNTDENGTNQIVFYAEGVGSGNGSSGVGRAIDRLGGGAFGWGLTANVEACYRFLVFNYEPGDEIYIFGFSRGAYTARSLGGMIRTCSIMLPEHIKYFPEAVSLYQKRGDDSGPDTESIQNFRARTAPHLTVSNAEEEWRAENLPPEAQLGTTRLNVTYLGIWDTVGALGIPNAFAIAGLFNAKYKFHDTVLSRSVLSARHALAVDEMRKSFEPTKWDNLDKLNQDNTEGTESKPRYLQQWFPGDHGSVGGGGTNRTLSAEALRWILEGATNMGLKVADHLRNTVEKERSHLGSIENSVVKASIFGSINKLIGIRSRIGPDKLDDVSLFAKQRWASSADQLPNKKLYRPKTLAKVSNKLIDGSDS